MRWEYYYYARQVTDFFVEKATQKIYICKYIVISYNGLTVGFRWTWKKYVNRVVCVFVQKKCSAYDDDDT